MGGGLRRHDLKRRAHPGGDPVGAQPVQAQLVRPGLPWLRGADGGDAQGGCQQPGQALSVEQRGPRSPAEGMQQTRQPQLTAPGAGPPGRGVDRRPQFTGGLRHHTNHIPTFLELKDFLEMNDRCVVPIAKRGSLLPHPCGGSDPLSCCCSGQGPGRPFRGCPFGRQPQGSEHRLEITSEGGSGGLADGTQKCGGCPGGDQSLLEVVDLGG